MYKNNEIKLINKINKILYDFKDFEEPIINKDGDIVIRKKSIVSKDNHSSILTNIFKEMIENDIKKNRV